MQDEDIVLLESADHDEHPNDIPVPIHVRRPVLYAIVGVIFFIVVLLIAVSPTDVGGVLSGFLLGVVVVVLCTLACNYPS